MMLKTLLMQRQTAITQMPASPNINSNRDGESVLALRGGVAELLVKMNTWLREVRAVGAECDLTIQRML